MTLFHPKIIQKLPQNLVKTSPNSHSFYLLLSFLIKSHPLPLHITKNPTPVSDHLCISIIRVFSRISKPELALELYNRFAKLFKVQHSLHKTTALAEAFCRAGQVQQVSEFSRKIEECGFVPDAVFYSCWIYGYFRNGELAEGLRKYKEMIARGIEPDVVNYTNVVEGFCSVGSVEKVVGVFDEMRRNFVEPNLVTYTSVIRGFCQRNKVDEAMLMFRKLGELGIVTDEVAYSVMICGLCRNGDFDAAFGLIEEMRNKGIEPGIVTMNILIDGLCKAGRVNEADKISRDIVADNFTYSILLHGYLREMNIVSVLQIKERLHEAEIRMDLVTCNVLIKALLMAGMADDAWKLFSEMPQSGLIPDETTYCTMMNGYCKLGFIDKALELCNEYKRTFTVISASAYNCLIKKLCKENMVDEAIEVFEVLMQKNLIPHFVTYRMLIRTVLGDGDEERLLNFISRMENIDPELLSVFLNDSIGLLCTKECYTAALDIYMLLRRRRLLVTSRSYYVLLKSLLHTASKHITDIIMTDCIKDYGTSNPCIGNAIFIYLCKKNVEEAIQFLSISDSRDFNLSAFSVAIDSLKRERGIGDAYKLFLKADDANLVMNEFVYSLVVDGLCKAGHLEKALDLCARMKSKGINPNIVIYNSIINGLCRQGCLTEAFRVFDSLEYHFVYPTVVTYATLVSALTREGYLQDASHLFERMVSKGFSPNTQIYNKLINGYCSFGLVKEAMKHLSDMEKSCLKPDAFTITSVISGYCLRGDIEGALTFFAEYRSKGYYPDFLGFMNLVKGLFCKGRMEETRSILKDMFRCREIENLINSVGDELNAEPLVALLSLASEQGKIKEVLLVLNEVGYTSFTSWNPKVNFGSTESAKVQASGSSCIDTNKTEEGGVHYPQVDFGGSNSYESNCWDTDIIDVTNRLIKMDFCGNDKEDIKGNSLGYDFETYYSIISTLCLQGHTEKASSIALKMINNNSAMGSCQPLVTI